MTDAEAVALVVEALDAEDLAVFTTGYVSRDAHAARDRPGHFYVIGSMGLASALGVGLALRRPERCVVVVEGDGSALMSLGTVALIGREAPRNLVHVVIDNRRYASTGGQPSGSEALDLAAVAAAAGYPRVVRASDHATLALACREARGGEGPAFIHAVVEPRRTPPAPRVALDPPALAARFRDAIHAVIAAAARHDG